jgi:hypothetical protein
MSMSISKDHVCVRVRVLEHVPAHILVRGGDTYKLDDINFWRYGAWRGSVNKI